MDHDLELISPILDILEIEVCNILQNPGNTGKLIFLFSHILAILEIHFLHFLLSWKYWKLKSPLFPGPWKYGRRAGGGGRAAPGVVLCCLGLFLGPCSWIGDM